MEVFSQNNNGIIRRKNRAPLKNFCGKISGKLCDLNTLPEFFKGTIFTAG
jgi:hypothetical protein